MTLCVVTWYGWEFTGCGRVIVIPPVDAGQLVCNLSLLPILSLHLQIP